MEEQKVEYLQYGGMAVPEGVMMRSPKFWSVAVRTSRGDIVLKTEALEQTWIGRQQWLKKPFLRGTLALLDTMALGLRAMNFASNLLTDERFMSDEEKTKMAGEKTPSKTTQNVAIGAVMLMSLAMGFLIFDMSPEIIAQTSKNFFRLSGTAANFIAESIKVVLFIGYLTLIRRFPPILEVFRYHGAEHQAINAREAKLDLSVENCLAQTRLHPRCGTNFAIIVIIIGFLIFVPVPRDLFIGPDAPNVVVVLVRTLIKLAIMPVVAGISYEIIRAAGKAKDQRWVEILLKPGLATQLITTEVPEGKHAEVAIAALRSVELAEETGVVTNTNLDELAAQPAPA